MKTAQDYRDWMKELRVEMVAFGESIPRYDREKVLIQASMDLNLSLTTIKNYLGGIGTDPETALSIKEKVQTLVDELPKA